MRTGSSPRAEPAAAPPPHKGAARRLLTRSIADGERIVTDAEVLQEILHRYVAIARRDAIQPAFDALLGVVDEVFAIEPADVLRAKEIVLASAGLSARDSIHLAVMGRRRVTRVMTFDAGFDGFPGVTRVSS